MKRSSGVYFCEFVERFVEVATLRDLLPIRLGRFCLCTVIAQLSHTGDQAVVLLGSKAILICESE